VAFACHDALVVTSGGTRHAVAHIIPFPQLGPEFLVLKPQMLENQDQHLEKKTVPECLGIGQNL